MRYVCRVKQDGAKETSVHSGIDWREAKPPQLIILIFIYFPSKVS